MKLEEYEEMKLKFDNLQQELEDNQLNFSKERFDLVEKTKELELKLKTQEEKNEHLSKRLGDLKEDMELIDEINEKRWKNSKKNLKEITTLKK